jgi:oligopeptide transport system ATP-binding protein
MTSLDPTMSVGKQIMEAKLSTPGNKEQAWHKAVKLLDEVGIPEPKKRMKNYPHQLSAAAPSGGDCHSLACDPDLLICDEPTTARM